MAQENLRCRTCKKSWSRPRVRGRKPTQCPSCRDNGNKTEPVKELPKPAEPATVKEPGGKTVYCTSKLHIICAEMMGKFPDEYPSCSCKCHKDK